MDSVNKENLAFILKGYDALPDGSVERQAGEKAAELLTEVDLSEPRLAVAEVAMYLAKLVYGLVEKTDVLGIGLLDGVAFLKMVESVSYGAALSVRDLLPEAPEAPAE